MTGLDALILRHQVEQFYYAEARAIDGRDFQAWLALFTDDTRYLVPIRRNQTAHEFTDSLGDQGLAHFDDDKTILARRVARMSSGLAWTEDPPSVQRHLITNVEVTECDPGNPAGELDVRSCFQAHRYRLDREVEVFTGARLDRLRRSPDTGFAIAARTVYLDHTTVLGNNLNLFL
jgi:3-phenylpropionate/cinnamic acid dioxygenase small subunit